MKSFTIYDTTTGAILRSGVTNIADPSTMLAAGEAIILDAIGNWETHKVDLTTTPPAIVSK